MIISLHVYQWLKLSYEAGGRHLTKPGWSLQTPYPFHIQLIWRYLHGGHKITFYRFNQGAHTMQGAQIGAGDWAPWPPQFSHWCLLLSLAVKEFWESVKNGKVMGKSIGCPVYFAPRGIYFDHRAKFGHVGGPKNMRILTRVPLRTGCVTPRNTPFSRVSWQIWLFWSNRMAVNDSSAEKFTPIAFLGHLRLSEPTRKNRL